MSLARLPAPDPQVEADARRDAVDAAVQRALGPYADQAVITVDELAELFGIARRTAFEAVKRGDVPSLRLGGRRIVIPVPALVSRLVGDE